MLRAPFLRGPLLRGFLPRFTRPLLPVSRAQLTRTSPKATSSFRSLYLPRPRLADSPPQSPTSGKPQTLSGRLKLLIKSYGWYTLGVYAILSALDFSVAFAAINILGADHVASLAASVKGFLLDLIGRTPSPPTPDDPSPHTGHEGTYAMLVLAYTVHKTLFLPVRVGLTAAVTPRFVGWLGRRGWTGTDGARRAAREMRHKLRRGSRESQSPSD